MSDIPIEMLEELKSLINEKNILTGEQIGTDFTKDELPGGRPFAPGAVVEAESTDDIVSVLRFCSEHSLPVTTRGAGTGLAGGSVPVNGGIVLSLRKMNRILRYDETVPCVYVQPGVLLQNLKADAESHGFRYMPDPGEKTSTVGGNASTNAGGPMALKYGCTKENVLSAEVVLADGSVMKLGALTGKSSSGYDLLRLVLGSEGTLCVISELCLRLFPKAGTDVSLILPFADTDSCISAALRIRREMDPSVLEYMDSDIVEFSGKVTGNPVFPVDVDGERAGADLLVTLEAEDDDGLDAEMEAMAELSEELECLDILVVDTPSLKRDMWAAHDAFHSSMETVKSSDELNMAVPPSELSGFLKYCRETGEALGLNIYSYAHVGDGGVHIHACSDEERSEFSVKMSKLADAAYARCLEAGGVVSSEHGIGYAKKAFLEAALGSGGTALLKRIKLAFDPKSILNPGKVVD